MQVKNAGARWINAAAVVLAALVANPGAAGAAPAADRAYTIANYPVEARAKDAVAAKDQAIADGQKAAFRSLLKRIVPVTAYRDLSRLGPVDAGNLIDGVAVRNERNSATEYIASYDFSFQAAGVRDLLTQQGIPYVDSQAAETILIPMVRDAKAAAGAAGEFRAASGTWANVWPGLDLTNTVAPLRIEPLKPIIPAETIRMLDTGSGDPMSVLAGEYKSDRVVAAVAEVDMETKRVNVLLAGVDAVGPFSLKRSYKLSDGDLAYTLELAAVVSQGILEGRWKAVNAPGGAGAGGLSGVQDIAFEAEYASTAEWNEMRRALLEAPGIDDIRIGSVTGNRASISLKFPGGSGALAAALAPYGLALENGGGQWVMRSERR